MRLSPRARLWLRLVRWPIGILFLLYVALVIYRIPAVISQKKTAEVVARIHAQRITLDDVMGAHLPTAPDATVADSTIAGVDANGNGIRDDVELAIFRLHPDSARIRSAELQYAMELQNELTSVTNSETLVAVMQEEGKGDLCISDTTPTIKVSDGEEKLKEVLAIGNARSKEVELLVFNISQRTAKQKQIFASYMESFSGLTGEYCDIDLSSLKN